MRETSHNFMRNFMNLKSSRNGEITLSFTDAGKSCPSREFLIWQICLLTLFSKIKFSRKYLNLQWPIRNASNYLGYCMTIVVCCTSSEYGS